MENCIFLFSVRCGITLILRISVLKRFAAITKNSHIMITLAIIVCALREKNFYPIDLCAPYETYPIYFGRMHFMNTLFDSVWNNGYMRNKILTMRLIVFFLVNLLLQGLFYQMSFCNSLFENYGAKIKICNLQIRHDIMPDRSTYDVTVYLDRYYGPI